MADVMTAAKRALKPGDRLDQSGGFAFYGAMDRTEQARALNALPVGLAPSARIVRAVAAGEIVTWGDVELEEGSRAVQLRRRQTQDRGLWIED